MEFPLFVGKCFCQPNNPMLYRHCINVSHSKYNCHCNTFLEDPYWTSSCRNGYSAEEESAILRFCDTFNFNCTCRYLVDSYCDLCEGLLQKDIETRMGYFYTKQIPVKVAFLCNSLTEEVNRLSRKRYVNRKKVLKKKT